MEKSQGEDEHYVKKLEKIREDEKKQKEPLPEIIGSHSIHCDQNLFIMHLDKFRVFKWKFSIISNSTSPILLQRAFLLESHMPEFHFSDVTINGRNSSFKPGRQLWEKGKEVHTTSMDLTLVFMSESFGNFEQRLIFEFGAGIKIVRNVGVQVSPESKLMNTLHFKPVKETENELVWIENHSIVPFDGEPEISFENLKYPLPPNINDLVVYGAFDHLDKTLTKDNYKERLHLLLHVEEFERRKELQKLSFTIDNIQKYIHDPIPGLHKNRILKTPCDDYNTEQGYQLIGKSGKALIKLTDQHDGTSPVFEVVLEQILSNEFVFEMSAKLDQYLQKCEKPVKAEFCFRFVNVFQFMHRAIDNTNLSDVFPVHSIPQKRTWSTYKHENLSSEQSVALNQMIAQQTGPPVLILGPFGSGKTRTMAVAVIDLLKEMKDRQDFTKRILICTHSNSAADHYLEDFLDPYLQREYPESPMLIRINWELRYTASVSSTVLRYCEVKDGRFVQPTKEELMTYNVVVCTLVTADMLTQLGIERDYFTHIFIDEAAQAMEVEALIPLVLKGERTKVILAGDHLQLGFPLTSPTAKHLGLGISLLERLFKEYPEGSQYKLKLLENFRSFKEIVEISSALFYEGALVANKCRPAEISYPLRFYGIHGKEEISRYHPSFYNLAEAHEVLYRIQELMKSWPKVLDKLLPTKICVLSCFAAQIQEIRLVLRRNGLSGVRVENVNNVQGLEFDVVIISTVRSYVMLSNRERSNNADLGFLSNPKLFNTAITRAKYLCLFIAEPVALCSFGACKALWKTLLASCDKHAEFHYRLTYDDVINVSEKLKETLNQDVNRSTRARSLRALYDEEQTLQNKEEPQEFDNSEGFQGSASEDNQSSGWMSKPLLATEKKSEHCQEILSYGPFTKRMENQAHPTPMVSTSAFLMVSTSAVLINSDTFSPASHSVPSSSNLIAPKHPVAVVPPFMPIGNNATSKTGGMPNQQMSRVQPLMPQPRSSAAQNSHVVATQPMPVFVYDQKKHVYTPSASHAAAHQPHAAASPHRCLLQVPVMPSASTMVQRKDRLAALPQPAATNQPTSNSNALGDTFSELEICNTFVRKFLQYLLFTYPQIANMLQAYCLKLEEIRFESQRLMQGIALYPPEYIINKLSLSSSMYVDIMSDLDYFMARVLPDISSGVFASNQERYDALHEALVDLKLSVEFSAQQVQAAVMRRGYITPRSMYLSESITKMHAIVSFVIRQLISCVRPLLGPNAHEMEMSLCNTKLLFLTSFVESLKFEAGELQRHIQQAYHMYLDTQEHVLRQSSIVGFVATNIEDTSRTTATVTDLQRAYEEAQRGAENDWDSRSGTEAILSNGTGNSMHKPPYSLRGIAAPSDLPASSTSLRQNQEKIQAVRVNAKTFLHSNSDSNTIVPEQRSGRSASIREDKVRSNNRVLEEVNWHLHDDSYATEDECVIRDTVSELLRLTSDDSCNTTEDEVENLTTLIQNLRQRDDDVDEWFVDRESDPFVREYIASFERHRALRIPSPANQTTGSSSTLQTTTSQNMDRYKMVPKYAPYSDNMKHQQQGTISFERSISVDKPLGIIMSGNQRICLPDLRSVNRSLMGDRVVYQITGTHGRHVKGRVTSVVERKRWSVVCKMSLTDNHLMIPFDERGPPIIVFNAPKAPLSHDRSVVGSLVQKFVVKVIGWPVEMMFPIGMIEKSGQEHTDK